MHDIKAIRQNPAAFDHGLRRRGLPPQAAAILKIDDTRRAAIHAAETALARPSPAPCPPAPAPCPWQTTTFSRRSRYMVA